MANRAADEDRRRERNEPPSPAEETEGGTIGNADEESSENRRDGLEKDRRRAEDPDDVMPRHDE